MQNLIEFDLSEYKVTNVQRTSYKEDSNSCIDFDEELGRLVESCYTEWTEYTFYIEVDCGEYEGSFEVKTIARFSWDDVELEHTLLSIWIGDADDNILIDVDGKFANFDLNINLDAIIERAI